MSLEFRGQDQAEDIQAGSKSHSLAVMAKLKAKSKLDGGDWTLGRWGSRGDEEKPMKGTERRTGEVAENYESVVSLKPRELTVVESDQR